MDRHARHDGVNQQPHMRNAPRRNTSPAHGAAPQAGARLHAAASNPAQRRSSPDAQHAPGGRSPQAHGSRRARAQGQHQPRNASRAARNHKRRRSPLSIVAGVAVLAALVFAVWNIGVALAGIVGGASAPSDSDAESSTIQEATVDPGDIVIGLNGDENTYVLTGEDYLEAGAHAAEPTDGILNDKIEISGDVDTSKAGDYTVTYRVKDSAGHVAEATRTVHVVDTMETQQDGIPIVMYHYVYSADNPPDDLNSNYILDTDLDAQLQYLAENDYYFPSYPELKAFIEGTHSLPAKSIVLTFDDGQSGVFTLGGPLFEKYHIPVTSFIICNNSDAGDVVVTYQNPYISFQSHSFGMHQAGGTVGHGGLISALSKDEIIEDLEHAQQILGTTEAFAYPFGDVTDDGRAAVEEAGILCAFTTKNAWAHVGDDVRSLPRVRMNGDTSLDGFISLIS